MMGDGPIPEAAVTDLNALESLYFAALEKPPAEHPAFLDAACGGDADLRARVGRLLAAQPKVGAFLDAPAATADLPNAGKTATFGSDAGATAVVVPEVAGALMLGTAQGGAEVSKWAANRPAPNLHN